MTSEHDELTARRLTRQLNNAARFALLHGTAGEADQIERLIAAVDHGHVDRVDALHALTDLRRYQQERAA